jgi:hypothetical protein
MPDMCLKTVAHVKSPAIAEFLPDDREAGKGKRKVTASLQGRKTDEYHYEENRPGFVGINWLWRDVRLNASTRRHRKSAELASQSDVLLVDSAEKPRADTLKRELRTCNDMEMQPFWSSTFRLFSRKAGFSAES